MKKIIFSTITFILLSTTYSFAQEADKEDFLFVGGTIGHKDIFGGETSNSHLTLGLEGLYMHKVVGNFAVGGGLNYNFGLTRTVKGSDEDTEWNNKFSTHDYNLSLLIGGIFDHNNGSRTSLIFGPTYGGATTFSKYDRNYKDDSFADVKNSYSTTFDQLDLRAGVYHQLANSNLTIGLNAKTNLTRLFGRTESRKAFTVMTSVGYTF